MEKKIYNIQFKAEAMFNSIVELTDTQLEKFKEAIGKNKSIGGNEIKFDGWSRFLRDAAEFDYLDRTETDIEEVKIEELDKWLQTVKEVE